MIVRGIERRAIFRSPADRTDFLRRLGENLMRSGNRCFSWALMTNHIHLLILSGARGLVELMQPLLTGYAVTFNLKYQRVGHLFQNRYKAIICEEDLYFLELVRYIALQPVQAGLIHTPEELASYAWTSYQALAGGPTEAWLEAHDVLSRFGTTAHQARQTLKGFLLDRWNQGRRDDLEGGGLLRSVGGMRNALAMRRSGERQMADVRILGSGSFVEDILRKADALEETNRQMIKERSFPELQRAIAQFSKVDPATLTTRDRRLPVVAARSMLVYAAREWLGIKGGALERCFGQTHGSLSKAFARGRQLVQDGQLVEYLRRNEGTNVP